MPKEDVSITCFQDPKSGERLVRLTRHGLGWFQVYLGDKGQFTAISDYGNWGYVWTAVGGPKEDPYLERFLRFLVSCDSSYVMAKLGQGKDRVFDGENSYLGIKEAILEARREGYLDAEEARREWNFLEYATSVWDLNAEGWWYLWQEETELSDVHEYWVSTYPGELIGFVEEVFCKGVQPALKEYLNNGYANVG